MPLNTRTRDLLDELIDTVAKPDHKDAPRVQRLKRRAEEKLKSKKYKRTDQFSVAKQLDGLQEKFQILSRDDLADGLRERLEKLGQHEASWFPEILSLLAQLSDRPTQFADLNRIEKPKTPKKERKLQWTELEVSGSAYCDDNIWENVDFAAESSDEEVSSVFSAPASPDVRPESSAADEEYVIPDDVFLSGEDEALIESISKAQFWKGNLAGKDGQPRTITELQLAREINFMLQGLPTSVFWRLDGSIEVDRRYKLQHSSNEALLAMSRNFSSIGAKLDVLRRFIQIAQSVLYMQTFQREIEGRLRDFDLFSSDIQSQYLGPQATVPVSLLRLLDDVQRESKILLVLSDLIAALRPGDEHARYLERLFDSVGMMQATGDDDAFRSLAKLFLSCFETYSRPIRLWMESGHLDKDMDEGFFVHENRNNPHLRTLWHDWYSLDESARLTKTPKFLWSIAPKIFTAGKSMVFLQNLDIGRRWAYQKTETLRFEDLFPKNSITALCLPFSASFGNAFMELVDRNLSRTSDSLRWELKHQCSLEKSLEVIEYIYLGKDVSVLSIIDNKIFDLLDQERESWNDRFLLTELAQRALGTRSLDPSSLVVRSLNSSSKSLKHTRSVKILELLSFDYALPWQVANIITPHCMAIYQRISTFLMQIRRAKYAIIKQRLQYSRTLDDSTSTLGYALRHNMLWFLNTLYSHMTDLVITTLTTEFRKSLTEAKDIDSMIAAHGGYIAALESQCLLSSNLAPIHDAVIGVLDSCIAFEDLQTAHHGHNEFSRRGVAVRRRKMSIEDADLDPGTDSESDDDDDIPFFRTESSSRGRGHGEDYITQLRSIKSEYDGLVSFVAAGLRNVGRVDGQSSLEVLAEKLEWREKERIGF